MTGRKIEVIQEELKKVIGPIGKFVVEKQITKMDEDKDNFPDDKLPDLIEKVVDIGVFDKRIQSSVKERIKNSLNIT
jgi:DNA-binding transcriptional regulator YhcF (GntR family)